MLSIRQFNVTLQKNINAWDEPEAQVLRLWIIQFKKELKTDDHPQKPFVDELLHTLADLLSNLADSLNKPALKASDKKEIEAYQKKINTFLTDFDPDFLQAIGPPPAAISQAVQARVDEEIKRPLLATAKADEQETFPKAAVVESSACGCFSFLSLIRKTPTNNASPNASTSL